MWLCRRHEPSNQIARWLELLSEFKYETEHRKGQKHGNADGLSRRACAECKQCQRIEQRDGGPSHLELAREESQGMALQSAGVLSRERVELQSAAGASIQDQKPEPTTGEMAQAVQSTTPAELQRLQSEGEHPVAVMYRSLAQGEPLTDSQLAQGSRELRQLQQRRHALRLGDKGLMEIRVCPQNKARWSVVCPAAIRVPTIWQAHSMAHSGMSRTLSRIQLAWYWPGMTADVRRVVRSCEVCQAAKSGGNHQPGGRQRLFVGRPWQKVAVDLVGPMPETNRGNRWILVLTDHFTRWQDALA